MLLAPESHERIESFLRDHLRRETLRLPPVYVYSGRMTRWLTDTFGILAITFGRRIFVAPKILRRDEGGRLTVPAHLIAHEATHVLQYQEAGFLGFLVSYLREYWRALKEQQRGWKRAARHAAYFAIRQEREAYEAESAYAVWTPLRKLQEGKETPPLPEIVENGGREK